jgi:thiamine pyrophosphate-dependent acetolactate synthase large subunit-like protein
MEEQKKPVRRGWELVGPALKGQGVDTVFFMLGIGGPHSPPVQSCLDVGMRGIYVRHEEAAAMMAHAYARMTGKPGVIFTPLGPATTNAITGVMNANMDAAPIVLIGGGQNRTDAGREAYQEQDQVAMLRPATKAAYRCELPEKIPELIARALHQASSGCKGAVYLDLAGDCIHAAVDERKTFFPAPMGAPPRPAINEAQLGVIRGLLAAAERPVILAGSGVIWSGAAPALAAFVDASGIPLVTTPQSRGIVPEDHELVFTVAKTPALQKADLVIILGTRANWINRHFLPPAMSATAKVVNINIDPHTIGHMRVPDVGVLADARTAVEQLHGLKDYAADRARWSPWTKQLQELNGTGVAQGNIITTAAGHIHPQFLVERIGDFLPRDAIFIVDGHETLEFARRAISSFSVGGYITSGPNGCMGVGVPMAIGAKVACPDRPVICFMGDGAFGWNGMEYDTAVRHGIPFVGIIGNNAGFTARPTAGQGAGRDLGFQRYDKVVEALGGYGELVTKPEEIRPALDRALASGKPALVNVQIDPDTPASGGLLGAIGSSQATK